MNFVEIFFICPDCAFQLEGTHGKTTVRPSPIDKIAKDNTLVCPVCGSKMIKIVNATWDEQWNAKSLVEQQIDRRAKLWNLRDETDKKNVDKIGEIVRAKAEAEKKAEEEAEKNDS